MSSNKLFRSAGWLAFAGAVLLIVTIVCLYIAHDLGDILLTIFFLLLIGIFYALYVAHRSESKGLSLAGLILVFPAVGVAIAANLSDNTFLSNLLYLLISLSFLIFGFLAFRSARMPRGLAVVTLLTGVTYLISGVAGLLGSQAIAGSVSTLSTLLVLVWLVWLWRVFLSKKINATLPEPVTA
jgi:hypothetical protein